MNTVIDNRYELIEKIGEGGMATVYKAHCNVLNRFVAIKILKPNFVKDKKFVKGFKNESRAAAQLLHANIVGIYDVGVTEDDNHYIVMEYVEGRTLSEVIEEKGRLSEEDTIDIAMQITSALVCAHQNGVIHRDVKPMNIIVNTQGVAKITDFGIAKATSATTTIINDNSITGSAHYFSPEQARGGYVDGKSDVYSMGIVIYEMITGRVPFDGDNPISIAMMHLNKEMLPPSVYNQDISPELEAIIMKASEKVPVNRFASADALLNALDNLRRKNNGDTGRISDGLIIPPVIGNKTEFTPGNYYNDAASGEDSCGLPDDLDSIIHVEEGGVVSMPGIGSFGTGSIQYDGYDAPDFRGGVYGVFEGSGSGDGGSAEGLDEPPMTDAQRRKEERRKERVKRSEIAEKANTAQLEAITQAPQTDYSSHGLNNTGNGIIWENSSSNTGAYDNSFIDDGVWNDSLPDDIREEINNHSPEYRDSSRDTFVNSSPYGKSLKHVKEQEEIQRQQEELQRLQEEKRAKLEKSQSRKPAKAKKKKSKITMPRIFGVIVGILLAAALSLGLLWLIDYIKLPDVEMPSIVGMDYMDAKDLLDGYGLEMEITSWEFSDKYAENQVCSQNKEEGDTVKEGTVVEVVVSKGLVENAVPDLDGMTVSDAQILIEQCGYSVGTITYEANALPEGTIIRQSPAAGSVLGPGTTIDLVCSDGTAKAEIEMVNVVGLTLDEAKEVLKGANLMVNTVKEKYSTTAKTGYIIEQSVPAGSSVMTGTGIDIVVSKGTAPEDSSTKSVAVHLDYSKASNEVFRLKIDMIKNGAMTTVYDDYKYKSDSGEAISVSGSGTAQLFVYFDGVKVSEGKIDFESGKYPA